MTVKQTLDIRGDYESRFGFHDPERYVFKSGRGLTRSVVEEISWMKGEPQWMREFRLRALEFFWRRPMPNWGGDLSSIDFDAIHYYLKPTETEAKSWDDV